MKSDKWRSYFIVFLLTITTLIFLFSFPNKITYHKIQTETALASTIKDEPSDPQILPQMPKVLLDISWCESRDNQNKVGNNYRYRIEKDADGNSIKVKYLWSKDIGRWQINEYYHLEEAKALGIDIYTEKGNAEFALLLYNKNSTNDWSASKSCWSNIEAWKAREQSYY